MKQALHFGGGSIGIGFIADLLHESNYEVTIVDIDQELVSQINETETFDLYLINEGYKKKQLTHIHGLSSIEDQSEIIEKLVPLICSQPQSGQKTCQRSHQSFWKG